MKSSHTKIIFNNYFADIPGYRFVPPKNVFSKSSENRENECFCLKNKCTTPTGLFDMSPCKYGSPILMSWPHFYQADNKLINDVKGLKPNQEKHQFYFDIQPKLGTPLRVQARSQINIQLYENRNIKVAKGMKFYFVFSP